jgi:hypothetical protein
MYRWMRSGLKQSERKADILLPPSTVLKIRWNYPLLQMYVFYLLLVRLLERLEETSCYDCVQLLKSTRLIYFLKINSSFPGHKTAPYTRRWIAVTSLTLQRLCQNM